MKTEFCKYTLDGIPITWQDLIKEAFHETNLKGNEELKDEIIFTLGHAIDYLKFLGHEVSHNPQYKGK